MASPRLPRLLLSILLLLVPSDPSSYPKPCSGSIYAAFLSGSGPRLCYVDRGDVGENKIFSGCARRRATLDHGGGGGDNVREDDEDDGSRDGTKEERRWRRRRVRTERPDLELDRNALPRRVPSEDHQNKRRLRRNRWSRAPSSSSPLGAVGEESAFVRWGVEYADSSFSDRRPDGSVSSSSPPPPEFPCTVESVAAAAALAVEATWSGTAALDPNVASNAMRQSALDYRPVYHHGGRDRGRIGVEVDGARFLLMGAGAEGVPPLPLPENDAAGGIGGGIGGVKRMEKVTRRDLEGRALRRVALVLAAKLADGIDTESGGRRFTTEAADAAGECNEESRRRRPVAVYFNSLRQTLLASRELQLLKLEERARNRRHHGSDAAAENADGGDGGGHPPSAYESIQILRLSHDDVPKDMARTLLPQRGRPPESGTSSSIAVREKRGRLESGDVDPSRGVLLAVQPSDRHAESRPPGQPVATAVPSLQRLSARAAVSGLPVVVLSPRLTEQLGPLETDRFNGGWDHIGAGGPIGDHSGGGGAGGAGFDQSGYQSSATYGGAEPPRGPTPWVLRDYVPPAFAWVGCALDLVPGDGSGRRPTAAALRARGVAGAGTSAAVPASGAGRVDARRNDSGSRGSAWLSYYSRLGLTHSVADGGRPWRVFAAEETVSLGPHGGDGHEAHSGHEVMAGETRYRYLACTKTSSGRPTRSILRHVFSEWY